MVSHINYDYGELVSYFNGVYVHQGVHIPFTIIKIINLESKDVIDIDISLSKPLDNERFIKDEILKEFNKTIK